MVSRADIVVPLEQREAVEAMGAMVKPINPTERNTLLCVIGHLLLEAFPEHGDKPYSVAEWISRDLESAGVSLGRQAIANKLIAAREALAPVAREAA